MNSLWYVILASLNMPAIKASNSKNIKVINSSFSGFETDIELDNVEGFISKNNTFSQENNPQMLINHLVSEIRKSKLDKSSKERLFHETFDFLSSKKGNKDSIKKKLMIFLGNKAVDYFIQLTAAVSAGLVLRSK